MGGTYHSFPLGSSAGPGRGWWTLPDTAGFGRGRRRGRFPRVGPGRGV